MKVKILGFELIPAKGVGLAELFQHFEATNGQLRTDRIVGVTSKDGFWIGVLLSIKDAKAFCRFRTQGTSFKVHPEGLGNDRIVDFNYFAICQKTGRGLGRSTPIARGHSPFPCRPKSVADSSRP